jgi:hypothetical protein
LSQQNYNLLNLALLFLIIFVTSYFIIKKDWPVYFIPFSVIPMLSTILFVRLEISLLITLASSITIASLAGGNFYLALVFFTSGIVSSLLVRNVRKRDDIFRAGFLIGLTQIIALYFIEQFKVTYWLNYVIFMVNGIASAIIVIGILPLFEHLFSTITNISLLELLNHPLLERLKMEAPGTHLHSLVVGNLSEAASSAIGANALLSRFGAYFHDIGKLPQPQYFSENQSIEQSRHETLSASMSKLIIMNHVKEGVELAKKYKLNPVLINFIQEHHGNSIVYYFYRRALESQEADEEVKEDVFRYPGPKPHTKETAIVLLADSVEAATRSLKDPAPAQVEEVVHKIINNKFIEGLLDECDLTLRDLEKISAVFIRILSGIFHSRVTYPEELRSGNNHKKFSKENSHQSQKDKNGNS